MTHLIDAYGDLAPTETYLESDGSVVDTYGDPEPVELWTEDCEPDETNPAICAVCGEEIT